MLATTTDGGPVQLIGRLDARGAGTARDALHAALATGDGELVVDLSGVELLDATGLGVLVDVHRRAGLAGRRLVLRNASPRVARLLAITRLNRVLAVESAGVAVPA
jgi:anti-sigma B factor antagonist